MSLAFNKISYAYGDVPVLSNVTFTAHAGKITCLLGPSGCGKTTLMHLAAGILKVQSGQVTLGGDLLASRKYSPPPEKRPVGVVFQEGALFRHMTVAQNIGFGLGRGGKNSAEVELLLQETGLSGLGPRYPHTLSGGQQQRVALARALAPKPKVLLLDEPFANIDIVIRRRLRAQTRAILKQGERIVLLVTHDPEEALEMADEIVVLSGGDVLQSGSPDQLYGAPKALSVATMISEAQPLPGTIVGDQIETPFGTWPLSCLARGYHARNGPVTLAVRPADLIFDLKRSGATLMDLRAVRGGQHLLLSAQEHRLLIHSAQRLPDILEVRPGDDCGCVPRAGRVFAFDRAI